MPPLEEERVDFLAANQSLLPNVHQHDVEARDHDASSITTEPASGSGGFPENDLPSPNPEKQITCGAQC